MLHIKASKPQVAAEPSSVAQISPEKSEPVAQVMSFDDEQNQSSMQVQFQDPDSVLTPVAELHDETTEANLRKIERNENSKDFNTSPNNLNTLRSDSKMLNQNKIAENDPMPEAEKSELINIDDS